MLELVVDLDSCSAEYSAEPELGRLRDAFFDVAGIVGVVDSVTVDLVDRDGG